MTRSTISFVSRVDFGSFGCYGNLKIQDLENEQTSVKEWMPSCVAVYQLNR